MTARDEVLARLRSNDQRRARRVDRIEPGFWRFRYSKGGPWVGAEVRIVDGHYLVREDAGPWITTIPVDGLMELIAVKVSDGEAFNHRLLRIAWFGDEITAADHAYLLQLAAWARAHAPDHPAARPYEPIDKSTLNLDHLF